MDDPDLVIADSLKRIANTLEETLPLIEQMAAEI